MRCPYCGAETKEITCEYCDSDLSFMVEKEVPEPENPFTHTHDEQRPFIIPDMSQQNYYNGDYSYSSKSKFFASFLCIIGMIFQIHGLHRFYVGKTLSGLFYFFTFGGFYLGTIVDLISISNGSFTDKDGRPLK